MQSLSWKRPVYGMPKKWVHSTKNENSFTNFKVCKFYSLIFQNLAMNSSEENMSNILYYTIIMLYITILYFTIYCCILAWVGSMIPLTTGRRCSAVMVAVKQKGLPVLVILQYILQYIKTLKKKQAFLFKFFFCELTGFLFQNETRWIMCTIFGLFLENLCI